MAWIGSGHLLALATAAILGLGAAAATGEGDTVAQNTPRLEASSAVDESLGPKRVHSYELALSAGQFLTVEAEQHGVRLALAIVDPSGKRIALVKAYDVIGTQSLDIISQESGIHRVEVHGHPESPAGRYTLRVSALRPSVDEDRRRIAAQTTFAEAETLRWRETAEFYQQALAKYQLALADWRSVADRKREADALNKIGLVFTLLHRAPEALDALNQARALCQRLEDRRCETEALVTLGSTYKARGEIQQAIEVSHQALKLSRASDNRTAEATLLANLGLLYRDVADSPRSLDYFQQAIARLREVRNPRLEAHTENNLGMFFVDLGETQQALNHLRRALALAREMKVRGLEAIALNNLGTALSNAGERDGALRHFEESLQLRREIGDRAGEANTLNNLGEIHRQQEQPGVALKELSRALELHRAVDNRAAQINTLLNLGAAYRDLGDRQKELEHCEQALRLSQQLGDRRGEVFGLLAVGRAHQDLGELAPALDDYRRALRLAQEIGDPVGEREALFGIASGERARGMLSEAREHMARAIGSLESMRSKIGEPLLRNVHLASVRDRYEAYIDLLMALHARDANRGYAEEALEASESARARGLLELLREARVDIRQGVDSGLLDRERRLRQQLNAKANRQRLISDGKGNDDERQRLAREIDALISQYQAVQAEVREGSPRYAALTEARSIGAAEIKALLDDETALLEYSLGDRRSHLWVATPSSIEAFELAPRGEIELLAQRLYRALTARARNVRETRSARARRIADSDTEARGALAEMSRTILGPALHRLGARRWVIVREGALDYVPFAALPIANGKGRAVPLIGEHEIIHLPSASALAELRRDPGERSRTQNLVAVLADPVFSARDPRVKRATGKALREQAASGPSGVALRSAEWLPRGENLERLLFTRREAEAISALAPGRSLKALDFRASRETATSAELEQYQILHFATHAFLNAEHPELSGIVLSLVDREGGARDGFLRLHDVYNLKLSADLVTLSGCETGLGKEIRGEGLVGLSRGFMYAGARRVMASLWRVDDAATAELMKHFYRALFSPGQVPPAAALRAAQLRLLKSSLWASPFYWSAFTLHGEWQD